MEDENLVDINTLQNLTREQLRSKVLKLYAHNTQLKNCLNKHYSTMGSTRNNKEKNKNYQKPFNFSKCSFRHILLKISYIGWDYDGFVIQEETTNTIENLLFAALIKTCMIKDRESSNYHRCGRTDKGVSSFGQVISVDVRSKLKENFDDITKEFDYCGILNRVLPNTIQVIAWFPVEENFSARFDCKQRVYKYFFPKNNLDTELMLEASKQLIGEYDFRNFCKLDVRNGVLNFTRTITDVSIELYTEGINPEYSMYVLTIKGSSFLWHQIRCIVSILYLIGLHKEEPDIITNLLDITTNPRKPEYAMASEIPLNLFDCEYDINVKWIYSQKSLKTVLSKWKSVCTFMSIKDTMLKYMIQNLETHDISRQNSKIAEDSSGKSSYDLVWQKLPKPLVKISNSVDNYVPLLKRQTCASLEERIESCSKKMKLTDLYSV